mmetsp:Transcript_18044/g.53982  ORF Transcript_18044/g.53982 Transcript_18044/m.53982 type:complete len:259 (+) Transcript_18044:1888-2664(+)
MCSLPRRPSLRREPFPFPTLPCHITVARVCALRYMLLSTTSLWQPFWGIFGAFDLNQLEEQIGHEMPTRIVAPLLLWVYMFVATIVLVNLLIAQMSDTYNRVKLTEGTLRWHFERASLILEFKDTKLPVPPPFNLAWLVLFELPVRMYKQWKGIASVADSGYKLIPPTESLQMLERKELEVLRKFLEASKAAADASTDAKLDVFAARMTSIEDTSASRFEKLNGRLEQIIARLDVQASVQVGGAATRTTALKRSPHGY